MRAIAYRIAGLLALAVGVVGIFLPLIPTVGPMILAAFCFAKSDPAWEARILADPRFGPHIRAWRERGAISRKGKAAASAALVASAGLSLALMRWPYSAIPSIVAVIVGTFVLTRPEA
jgi:uncharacterized protein